MIPYGEIRWNAAKFDWSVYAVWKCREHRVCRKEIGTVRNEKLGGSKLPTQKMNGSAWVCLQLGSLPQNVVQSYVRENMMFQPLNSKLWNLGSKQWDNPIWLHSMNYKHAQSCSSVGNAQANGNGPPYSDHDTLETSIKHSTCRWYPVLAVCICVHT